MHVLLFQSYNTNIENLRLYIVGSQHQENMSVNPLIPHFYIIQLGNAEVYLFFLLLLLNIDCGYSLEPPRRGGSNVYLRSMFWAKNKKNIEIFLMKFNFYR